jgi:hypothetical protein
VIGVKSCNRYETSAHALTVWEKITLFKPLDVQVHLKPKFTFMFTGIDSLQALGLNAHLTSFLSILFSTGNLKTKVQSILVSDLASNSAICSWNKENTGNLRRLATCEILLHAEMRCVSENTDDISSTSCTIAKIKRLLVLFCLIFLCRIR